MAWSKERQSVYYKEWRKNHLEDEKKRCAEYRNSEKGRNTRKKWDDKNRDAPFRKRFLVLSRARFKCEYCGVPATEAVLQVDHVIPRSKGGGNGTDNLVAACIPCNLGKSDLLL